MSAYAGCQAATALLWWPRDPTHPQPIPTTGGHWWGGANPESCGCPEAAHCYQCRHINSCECHNCQGQIANYPSRNLVIWTSKKDQIFLSKQGFCHLDKKKGSNLFVSGGILSFGQEKRIKFACLSRDFVIWTSKRIKFAFPTDILSFGWAKRIKFACPSRDFVIWTSKKGSNLLVPAGICHLDKQKWLNLLVPT